MLLTIFILKSNIFILCHSRLLHLKNKCIFPQFYTGLFHQSQIRINQTSFYTNLLRLDLEYDGGDFRGWQVQSEGRTVQGVLEAALYRICAAVEPAHAAPPQSGEGQQYDATEQYTKRNPKRHQRAGKFQVHGRALQVVRRGLPGAVPQPQPYPGCEQEQYAENKKTFHGGCSPPAGVFPQTRSEHLF